MESAGKTGHSIAAKVIMWTTLGIAITALALWLLNVIGPPAGIIGGATAVIVMLAAARLRNKADR